MNQVADTITGTALTAPVPTDLQALFAKPDGIKEELARIKAKAVDAAKALDVSKPKDRDAIKSVAFQVVKRKTALDAAGKELNEERRKLNDAVDAERRLIRETLDRVAEELRAPVIEWEAKEAARVNAIRARLDASFKLAALPTASADLIATRAVVDAVPLDASWAEFIGEAEAARAMMMTRLDREIDAAIEREEAAAELARLRKEAAERAEADRLAREAEAAEAAERQRVADEAAAKAKAAQEAAEAAQREAEREADDLRRKLAEAAQREADAMLAAEQAAEKARQDEAARIAREAAKADQAKRDEAERIAAEKAAAEFQAAMAAKAEDRRIEAYEEILFDLTSLIAFSPDAVATALMKGAIRNVEVVL